MLQIATVSNTAVTWSWETRVLESFSCSSVALWSDVSCISCWCRLSMLACCWTFNSVRRDCSLDELSSCCFNVSSSPTWAAMLASAPACSVLICKHRDLPYATVTVAHSGQTGLKSFLYKKLILAPQNDKNKGAQPSVVGSRTTDGGWKTSKTGTQLDSRGTTQDWSTAHHLERQYQKRHREQWSHMGRGTSPDDWQKRMEELDCPMC